MLRERTERGVYAASASRGPVTLRNSPSARKLPTLKAPEGRAPAHSPNENTRIIFTKVQEFAVMTTLLGKGRITVMQIGGHAARLHVIGLGRVPLRRPRLS